MMQVPLNLSCKNLYFLIPIAALNRETAIALVLLYFLTWIGREKNAVLFRRTFVYGLLWLIPSGILAYIFGFRTVGDTWHFWENVRGLLSVFSRPNIYNQFYFLLYLCGFYWILAFRNFRNKDLFLQRSVIMVIAFFLFAFIKVARISEVRMFMPFYVFIIPLGLFSLFEKNARQKKDKARSI